MLAIRWLGIHLTERDPIQAANKSQTGSQTHRVARFPLFSIRSVFAGGSGNRKTMLRTAIPALLVLIDGALKSSGQA